MTSNRTWHKFPLAPPAPSQGCALWNPNSQNVPRAQEGMSGEKLPEVDMEDPGLPGGPGGPGNPSPRQKGHKKASGRMRLSNWVNACQSCYISSHGHSSKISKCRLVSLFSPHTSIPVSYFSLSFATTADIGQNSFLCGTECSSHLAFAVLKGKVHFITHLTCSPLLLSRE